MKSDLSRKVTVLQGQMLTLSLTSALIHSSESPMKHSITQLEEDCKTEGPISHCLQIGARFHFSYLSSVLFCRKHEF